MIRILLTIVFFFKLLDITLVLFGIFLLLSHLIVCLRCVKFFHLFWLDKCSDLRRRACDFKRAAHKGMHRYVAYVTQLKVSLLLLLGVELENTHAFDYPLALLFAGLGVFSA